MGGDVDLDQAASEWLVEHELVVTDEEVEVEGSSGMAFDELCSKVPPCIWLWPLLDKGEVSMSWREPYWISGPLLARAAPMYLHSLHLALLKMMRLHSPCSPHGSLDSLLLGLS